jgi:hypothetical protein
MPSSFEKLACLPAVEAGLSFVFQQVVNTTILAVFLDARWRRPYRREP